MNAAMRVKEIERQFATPKVLTGYRTRRALVVAARRNLNGDVHA